MSVFSFSYPEEEDKKGELPAAPHSNESRWNKFYVLSIINWFGLLMVIMLLFKLITQYIPKQVTFVIRIFFVSSIPDIF